MFCPSNKLLAKKILAKLFLFSLCLRTLVLSSCFEWKPGIPGSVSTRPSAPREFTCSVPSASVSRVGVVPSGRAWQSHACRAPSLFQRPSSLTSVSSFTCPVRPHLPARPVTPLLPALCCGPPHLLLLLPFCSSSLPSSSFSPAFPLAEVPPQSLVLPST
jgi:hypothetical protein